MKRPDLEDTSARQLAEMLSFDADGEQLWGADELAAVLQHQLSMCPESDLYINDRSAPSGPPPKEIQFANYLELLNASNPPLDLLQRMKQVSKAAVKDPDSPLPDEVATSLYFAAIAAAQLRCGNRITQLGDDGLRWGYQWAIDQPWMVDELKTMFGQCLDQISGP